MKIAYITQVYPPVISGAARVVQLLAEAMQERGHQVLVVTSSDEGRPYRRVEDHIEVLRIRSSANPLRVGSRFALLVRRPLVAALRAFQPDVIHVHDPSQMGVRSLQEAKRMGVPTVYTCHQLPWFISAYLPGSLGVRTAVEKALWQYGAWVTAHCEEVVVCTKAIADEYMRHLARQPLLIGCGVDRERFTPVPAAPGEARELCRRYMIEADQPVVLHVGRLDLDKGVQHVVEAAAIALRDAPGQLLIVGDGTQRRSLQELAAARGIGNRAVFTGYVRTDGDLPGLYRLGDVFVTASQIETQGLVLLEAMASGLPVVAVRATCVPEVVREGVSGLLADPGDLAGMANHIRRLLGDPARARRMGANARDLSEVFSLKTSYDQHENVYRRLIDCCE